VRTNTVGLTQAYPYALAPLLELAQPSRAPITCGAVNLQIPTSPGSTDLRRR